MPEIQAGETSKALAILETVEEQGPSPMAGNLADLTTRLARGDVSDGQEAVAAGSGRIPDVKILFTPTHRTSDL